MYTSKLTKSTILPTDDENRTCTDVICTIIAPLFALTMLIIAFSFMNKDNYLKTNYPTDSDHIPCGYGLNSMYSYTYFPDVSDSTKRVCVSSCPQRNDIELQCRPNKVVTDCRTVDIYDSIQNFERLGGFCSPTDSVGLRKLNEQAGLGSKWKYLNTYDSIRLSILLAVLIGVIWMVLVQWFPKIISYVVIIMGVLVTLGSGILLLIDNCSGWQGKTGWRIAIGVILIIISIFIVVFVKLNSNVVKITSIFLKSSTQFIGRKWYLIALIPLFIGLTCGLIILCVFQHLAFSSKNDPIVLDQDIYLRSQTIPALFILNIVQFIWGLQFLKDSFNFIISGYAADWYILKGSNTGKSSPIGRYFKYNFGSVIAGSFLNAFFNFIQFLFQAFRCYPEGHCGVCAHIWNTCSQSRFCFIDLVRTDAYSYINLVGIPYCNAARNCQIICHQTSLFTGYQSGLYFYRCCAHLVCVGLTTLLGYWLMKAKIEGISTWSLILIIILSYCMVSYMIDIHADSAEGIQISELIDRTRGTEKARDQNVFEELKRQIDCLVRMQN